MKIIFGSRRNHHLAKASVFLITAALIAGMIGCVPISQNLEIQNWYDLDDVRNNLDGNHILMNDLDSITDGYEELASPTANGGKGWQPIGTIDNQFTGSFDGQGYEISDMYINRPDANHVGLFGSVDDEGVIQDIGVVNATVSGLVFVGGLVGINGHTVSNSYSTGSVTSGGSFVGGLVGENMGTISDSYSTSSVTGNSSVGGLVGRNDEGNVSNSYSTGNVTGVTYAGGLVGVNEGEGTISNSYWNIETSGQNTSSGGTGLNTTELKGIATFSGAGWDIVAVANPGIRNLSYIWNIVDDETYPFLSWQP